MFVRQLHYPSSPWPNNNHLAHAAPAVVGINLLRGPTLPPHAIGALRPHKCMRDQASYGGSGPDGRKWVDFHPSSLAGERGKTFEYTALR